MQGVLASPNATMPGTPYRITTSSRRCGQVGMHAEATQLLHSHWGGMIRKGADTFLANYVPDDEHASPYTSHLMNSYCHTWSCNPIYLLRGPAPLAP